MSSEKNNLQPVSGPSPIAAHTSFGGPAGAVGKTENNMSEYIFGSGSGWLPKKADKIAREHGASLVNYCATECNCGWGCAPHDCPASKQHWFAGPNRGEPFNSALDRAVMAELKAAKIGLA